jgi:hypothetical protein
VTIHLRTELGRISADRFGLGGYQDAMVGLLVTLSGKTWSVRDFKGAWGIDRSDRAKWSEEDRLRDLGLACMFLRDLLTKVNKQDVSGLVGIPIEATFSGNSLESWRLLDEVLP